MNNNTLIVTMFGLFSYNVHNQIIQNNMKTVRGEKYLLHWKKNPTMWDEKLKDLIKDGLVIKKNSRSHYYSVVTAHYTGDYSVVDCTCADNGDFYPVNTSNLIPV